MIDLIPFGEFELRRISPPLLHDFSSLFKLSFGYSLPKTSIEKKFDTSYTGASYIGYLAYDQDNTPAAYYGVYPCMLQHQDEIILGGQAGDGMTHPKHRKKGLFNKLVTSVTELSSSMGIKFIYGLANDKSYPAFVKLGWNIGGKTRTYHVKTDPTIYSRLIRKANPKIYQRTIKNKLDRYSINPKNITHQKTEDSFHVLKNEDYFQYKGYSKNQFISLATGVAWIKVRPEYNDLVVGDLFPFPGNSSTALCRDLVCIGNKLGVNNISFNMSKNCQSSNELERTIAYKESEINIITLELNAFVTNAPFAIKGGDFDTY